MAIGGCTIDELQARMSHREFVAWMAYDEINPFGPERADWRSAMITSVNANVLLQLFAKQRPKTLKPADFMFKPADGEPDTDWRVMRARLQAAISVAQARQKRLAENA